MIGYKDIHNDNETPHVLSDRQYISITSQLAHTVLSLHYNLKLMCNETL